MVMTLKKITAGDGYLYLTRQVAHGDDGPSAYYTAAGNPPGRWIGRGAPLLGIDGKEVTEDQMRALFGHGAHPDEDAIIGAYLAAHTRPAMTGRQRDRLTHDAIRAARLGRPFPAYQPLGHYDTRVDRRLAIITKETGRDPTEAEIKKIRAEESRRQRAAVAGFDLVFSPVKSAALLWAIDPREHVRDAIRQAHGQAMHRALALIEDHAAYTRAGAGGIAQIATRGLIAAAFEHWDSRAGDPNLHTHVAVSSKVQGTDGTWRSLDARGLYAITVAASELYNTAFETALTNALGVTFTARPGTAPGREPVREITGIPPSMITWFSRRRTQLEGRYAQLSAHYRRAHGHDPDRSTCHQLAQQACLDTRTGKNPPVTLDQKRARWRKELTTAFGPHATRQIQDAVPHSAALNSPAVLPDPAELAERAVDHVSRQRSTWTIWNLRAEAERLLREHGHLPGLDEHRLLAEEITARAVALSVCCEAPALLDEPAVLRRDDGESVFSPHGAARYTSQAVLDAEQRLITATRTPVATTASATPAAAVLDGYEATSGTVLDAGQRHLVTAFASSDRLLLAGIGPAGTGKTTAMRALACVLGRQGRRLVPLATSAAAAAVLADELGVPAENLHKFLHEWTRGPHAAQLRSGGRVPRPAALYALRPGDVVLVDEAGMAGTFLLDQLVTIASGRGAVVRLLGDDRQLSAVESGGALRLIAAQPGTVELSALYRFRDPAEATATIQIRVGDTTAITWYADNRRIRSGSRDAMTEAAYTGWAADMRAGKLTLMAAGDTADMTALAARARADRVAAGHVEPGGVPLRDGNTAGAGDWIITRDNQRRVTIHDGRDWVKNGDAWLVTRRHADGSLTCKHLRHNGHVRLPSAYVQTHVELLYAVTAHRAQGTTVDTAHPLITETMTREMLYVLASRAREKTTLYVATHDLLPADSDDRTDRTRSDPRSYAAREILHKILATEGAELSATETIHRGQDKAESLATLAPRYLHAAHQLAGRRYQDAAVFVFGEQDGNAPIADSAWGALVRRLYDAEITGWQPERLLAAVARQRELGTADSVAEVLCWRIDGYIPDRVPPPHLHRPSADDIARYVALLSAQRGFGAMAAGVQDVTAVPAVLSARQSECVSPGGTDCGLREDFDADVAAALGPGLARRAQAEPAWPAVQAALRRAATAGHDPAAVLTVAARGRQLKSARTVSEFLAWRIGRYLTTVPSPAGARPGSWHLIAWMLKAAETYGTPAEDIAATWGKHGSHLAIADLQAAARPQRAGQSTGLPPWLASPITSVSDERDAALSKYLDDATAAIKARVQALTTTVTCSQPAWKGPLGDVPCNAGGYELWSQHVGIIAAYRDQYQVESDDPRQVLGPYPEPGRAGYVAYWHAVESVLAARELAEVGARQASLNHVMRQAAADIYRALPQADRKQVDEWIAARFAQAGCSSVREFDDNAVVHPACAAHLVTALMEHGHIVRAASRLLRPTFYAAPVETKLPRHKKIESQDLAHKSDVPPRQRTHAREPSALEASDTAIRRAPSAGSVCKSEATGGRPRCPGRPSPR